jgi:CHASE1-domain containing sensor protein
MAKTAVATAVEEKRERAKRARRASLRQNSFMVMISDLCGLGCCTLALILIWRVDVSRPRHESFNQFFILSFNYHPL